MYHDFNKLKKDVSLADLMIDVYGYKPVAGSTHKNPKLSDGFDTYVLYKDDKGFNKAFDVHNENNRFSILDFVQHEHFKTVGQRLTISQAADVLSEFQKSGKIVHISNSAYNPSLSNYSAEDISKTISSLSVSLDTPFLASRGFSPLELSGSPFSKRVLFNPLSGNTAFVMSGIEEHAVSYRGLNPDGTSFKGFAGPRGNCIAASVFDESKPINTIYVSESFLDAMAHWNLKNDPSKNNLYVSTEGAITDTHVQLLQRLVYTHKPQNLSILQDNDHYGHFFSHRILSQLKIPSSLLPDATGSFSVRSHFNNIPLQTPYVSKFYKVGHCFIHCPPSLPFQEANVLLNQYLTSSNKVISTLNNSERLSLSHLAAENPTQNHTFVLTYPNSIHGLEGLNTFTRSLRSNDEFFSIEKPLLKDFNLDLQLSKNMLPDYSLQQKAGSISVQYSSYGLSFDVGKEHSYISKFSSFEPPSKTNSLNNELSL